MPTKLTSKILAAAIVGYEAQKKQLDSQIAELRQLLSPASTNGSEPEPVQTRRKMSAAARRRIAAAQRKRWAGLKAGAETTTKTTPTVAKKKRRLSAAGRKAIIEATRRRWAAAKKSAKG
jgi:hypothetical protein